MADSYVKRDQEVRKLMGQMQKGLPDTMAGFSELHEAAIKDGTLGKKMKELIALAIGITVRCDGCIAYHVREALQAGATRDEIMETIGVAILMGGGPSVVYSTEAFEALNQFEAEGVPS